MKVIAIAIIVFLYDHEELIILYKRHKSELGCPLSHDITPNHAPERDVRLDYHPIKKGPASRHGVTEN